MARLGGEFGPHAETPLQAVRSVGRHAQARWIQLRLTRITDVIDRDGIKHGVCGHRSGMDVLERDHPGNGPERLEFRDFCARNGVTRDERITRNRIGVGDYLGAPVGSVRVVSHSDDVRLHDCARLRCGVDWHVIELGNVSGVVGVVSMSMPEEDCLWL